MQKKQMRCWGKLILGNIEGNPDVVVGRLSKIEEAQSGDLSFLANPKYENFIYTTNASIVIVNTDFTPLSEVSCTLIRVKNAYSSFSELLSYYNLIKQDRSGREEPVFVHESVNIGENEYLGAFSYIGKNTALGKQVKVYPHVYIGDNVQIGNNVTLFPGVKVYSDCVIGNNVVIHAGVVIGSDGFGFAPQEDGTYGKVPQIGNVIIEDDVEIGANTVIDRATMGSTIIRQGVKLDNLIQIAHNVEIGKNTVIAAQTGVSGSTKLGEQVVLGGQVGVVGHITIADRSQVQAQSGINRSITVVGKKWGGSPATPYQSQLRSQVIYARLPELEKRISELEHLLQMQNIK